LAQVQVTRLSFQPGCSENAAGLIFQSPCNSQKSIQTCRFSLDILLLFLFGFSIRQFRVEFSLWIDQVLASFHVWPFANAATGH